ncbi:MAG: hypothetical protein LBB98_13030, partial [Treponema sp.]|nr:hypothetical protein [Treponema sp.]
MKNAKLIGLFAKSGRLYAGLLPGFLAALLLAGCFNPITAIPPKTGDPITDPFTINIMIGKDGSARTVAGPDSARIKGADIRNFIQLVVVNNETKQIVAFDEDRRESGTDGEATLSIESIAFGKTYTFLLLMGHWEHNNYTYYDGKNDQYEFRAPTLLAAGLKELPVTGSGTITIVMWPIVVDTVFTTTDPEIPPALQTAGSVVDNGKPGTVSLFPVGWGITWTVKKGTSGNGFEYLVRAQKVLKNDAGDELLVKSKKPIVRGDGLNPSEPVVNDTSIGNVITLDISAYTSGIQRLGTAGSANFNLEYIPFNLTDGAKWTPFKDNSEFDLDGNSPVWIIRNGINNEAQNYATDFTGFGKNAFANGNGAVSFEIGAEEPDPNHPKIGDPAIKNGKYEGPAGSLTPAIGFTTEGYTGTAGVYYAVVDAGASKPAYTAYTGNLGFLPAGTYTGKPITLPISGETGYQADGDYDVYVVVLKGGKVSKPVKINTTKGGEDIDYIWGDVPYLKLYVRSNGNNNDEGDKDHPLETVDKALEKIAAAYAADASWPEKGTPNAVSAGIVVLDTVNVTQTINITGTSSNYPPIFLTDEGYGGTLQADSLSSGSSLLSVFYGTNVTLDGGLIL